MWSRVGVCSMTVVFPGVFSPARRTADLTWADGTGSGYSIGTGVAVPCTTSGRRPPSRASTAAPIRTSGTMTRFIGRDESDRMSSAYEAAVPPAQEPCSELGEKADRKFVEMQLRALR